MQEVETRVGNLRSAAGVIAAAVRAYVPHPIARQQVEAPQPPLLVLLAALASVNWLPRQITFGLMHRPGFRIFTAVHSTVYISAFFAVQMSLSLGLFAWFSSRYADAAWRPKSRLPRALVIALAISAPLLLYYSSKEYPLLLILSRCTPGSPEAAAVRSLLPRLFDQMWNPLAYGTTAPGVVFSSAISFIAPPFEELFLSGFLLNKTARSVGFGPAVLVEPLLFSLAHLPQVGLGSQLVPLYFAGLTYALVRIGSGSLRPAIASHLAVNFVIFFPRWVIAVLYFGSLAR